MRRGEIVALRWDDISFDRNTINIDKTVSVAKDGSYYVSNSAKTETSTRVLHLPKFVLDQIRELRKDNIKNNFTSEYVFPNDTGKRMNVTTPYQMLKKFYANYPSLTELSLHEFRHNFASMLRTAKVDYKSIQDMLGHTSEIFTLNKYVHSTSEIEKENIIAIEKYIAK